MRSVLAAALIVALGAGAAMSARLCSGCAADERSTEGGSGGAPSGGAGGAGGLVGVGGDASSTGGAASDGGGTGGAMPSDEACAWPGWFRHPRLPVGCTGTCVPDDLAKRLPKIEWLPKTSWCAGCLWLATPWAKAGERTVVPGVRAVGPGVKLFALGIQPQGDAGVAGWYRGDGSAIAGWRSNYDIECGRVSGLAFNSAEGLIGVSFDTTVGADQHYVVRPLADAGSLMTAKDTTLLFAASFTNTAHCSEAFFSSVKAARFCLTGTAIGEMASQSLKWVTQLAGAPQGGQFSPGPVVGNTAFMRRFLVERSEWWVEAAGQLTLFMGDASHDIRQLQSDGSTIVWVEGTSPVVSGGETTYTKYDLYKAAFVADPKQLAPTLLKAGIPSTLRSLTIANGFVSGTYLTQLTPTQKSATMVVRLDDGAAWRSQLPDGYNWGDGTFPSPDELWGAAVPGVLAGKAESFVRMPYSAMESLP